MSPLITFLLFLFLHFCLVTLFFAIVQRPFFYFYNRSLNSQPAQRRDLTDITRHGLYTDVKVAAYAVALPVILTWVYIHVPQFNLTYLIVLYDIIMSLVVALISIADTILYKFWQFKIEASVLAYLRSLKGAFASVSVKFVVLALIVVVIAAVILAVPLIGLAYWPELSSLHMPTLAWWQHVLVAMGGITLTASLYCIIRGLHIRPDTPVYSYYCNNQFLNHCAVNPVYNFIYSIHLNDDFANQFQSFDADWCQQQFAPLFPNKGIPQLQLLNTDRPNILVIVWESLCARFVGCMGGNAGVMPQFDRLAEEGILFTNCWAGSFRTDRGLVCILSGYLGQPTTSVILHTSKLPHLPALPRTLRDQAGYETMAVHGGELKIFHKSDYYWASGHDRLVEEEDFPNDPTATRWGVQDGKVFEWLKDDIIEKAQQGRRWFTTFQTLSSHEPFKVPYERIADNPVDNAYAYVDDALGRFVDDLKSSPAWKDLLIVITGDHGLNLNEAADKDRNTHIPLLLLGGALHQSMKIDTLMNQTDIAATLLGQMGLPHEDFIFSRDVLADTYTYPFAFHTYNNAYIFRDSTGVTHFDNVSQQPLDGHDEKREQTAKVILQTLYTDLSKR